MKGKAYNWIWRVTAVAFFALAVFFLVRGCAFMPWNAKSGTIAIRVTVCKDFGKVVMKDADFGIRKNSSAMDALREVAEVDTAYGGGFIQAVDGVASQYEGGTGRKRDWFFYVNGQMADVGAGAYQVREGDWLIFDFHNWEYSMFTPVLAGCFPEPFVHGYAGAPESITVAYAPGRSGLGEELADFLAPWSAAPLRLLELSAEWRPEKGEYALLVGAWDELAIVDMVRDAFQSHARLGLFAFFEDGELRLLDDVGAEVRGVSGSVGLVQGFGPRLGEEASALVITGSDEAGLRKAMDQLLGEHSRVPAPVPGLVFPPEGGSLSLPLEVGEGG